METRNKNLKINKIQIEQNYQVKTQILRDKM